MRSGRSSRSSGAGTASTPWPGECTPPIDVYETDSTLEISVDLPGVDPSVGPHRRQGHGRADCRRQGTAPRARRFELSPRRARIRAICADRSPLGPLRRGASARAVLEKGELRISLPKVAERRGPRDSRSTLKKSDVRILFIGDIVGKPGRDLIRRGVGPLVEHHQIDLVVANAENAAAGSGITREIGDQILGVGRRRDDVGQSHLVEAGSHRLHRRRAAAAAAGQLSRRRARATAAISRAPPMAGRPASSTSWAASSCSSSTTRLRSSCARSRRCGSARRSSWSTSTRKRHPRRPRWVGISTARSPRSIGTHTHVQTADERILPKGTAYLTDVGMTGPHDSIIGVEIEPALKPVPDRDAEPLRAGDREPAPERGHHRRRRKNRARRGHRAVKLQPRRA